MYLVDLHNNLVNIEYELGINGNDFEVIVIDDFGNEYNLENISVDGEKIIIEISN